MLRHRNNYLPECQCAVYIRIDLQCIVLEITKSTPAISPTLRGAQQQIMPALTISVQVGLGRAMNKWDPIQTQKNS